MVMELRSKVCPTCIGTGRIPDKIGKQMKAQRVKAGVRAAHLARAMGLSQPYIADLEADRRRWTDLLVSTYLKRLEGLCGSA